MPAMMQTLPASYREEFARIARRRQEETHASERERDRRKERNAADRDDDVGFESAALLASQEQVAAFNARLDSYEARIVEELLANEERLAELRRQRDELLNQAFVLPDGRRVFKSEDGQRVFDECGTELAPDDVDPHQIPDGLPTSEAFLRGVEADQSLMERNAALQDGLDRIADAREHGNEDGVSAEALDAIMGDLDAAMMDIRPGEPAQPTQSDAPRAVNEPHQPVPAPPGGP